MEDKFETFAVPDYAMARMRKGEGAEWGGSYGGAPTRRLSELDADTLAVLCDRFRVAVFAKAGVVDPRKED